MKLLPLLLAVVLAVLAATSAVASPLTDEQHQFLFTRFVEKFDKQYESNDFFTRYKQFKSNLNKIVSHNAQGRSYTMAVNKFADLDEIQFMRHMGFKVVPNKASRKQAPPQRPCPLLGGSNELAYVDWRTKNVLNPVKDQASCGSCWAFSTIQSLEAANAIATGKLLDLSEQQLVDCSGSTGNEGCNGGLMDNAFDYLISAGGACLTSDYEYTARDGTCKKCTPAVKVKGYTQAGSGNAALSQTLQQGPIAVALSATSKFQFYSSGVFKDCASTSLNHAVGLVGLVKEGSDPTIDRDAFVIRNSWGKSWGVDGHIYLDATQEDCLGMSVTSAKWNVIPTV